MAHLHEQIEKLLPEYLQPGSPLPGTELAKLIARRLELSAEYIRQELTKIVKKPTTRLGKIEGRRGYVLKETPAIDEQPPSSKAAKKRGQIALPEEKFRALYCRLREMDAIEYPLVVPHLKAKRGQKGQHEWKFPDVILLKWLIDSTEVNEFIIAEMAVRRALSEPLFWLTSVELKVEVPLSSAREVFFQCLSNSRWANTARLVIACPLDPLAILALRRLGNSYGIEVVTLNIPREKITNLPAADKINSMPLEQIDTLVTKSIGEYEEQIIVTGEDRHELDWSHIGDMRDIHPSYTELFEWISFCLENNRPFSATDARGIQERLKGKK